MKKFILAAAVVALAALNVQSATHAKVQLWEGGPYWATTNIGADKPEDYGLYFWWGDTVGDRPSADGKFDFQFVDLNTDIYTYRKAPSALLSAGWVIVKDGRYVLAPSHDAAHVQWGGGWRMPTSSELYTLRHNCDWMWTTKNGVYGYAVRGRGICASNSIFLPASGCGNWNSLVHASREGRYRSSLSVTAYSTEGISFDSDGYYHGSSSLYQGYSIRPVQDFVEEAPAECVIHFNANGGTGNMDEQIFEEGNEQKLSKNTYRKDGYVFQGWAVAADGEVVYKDEASITIDSDMTLYAVWDNPPLTLTAESADWSRGSITLRCEDPDTSGAAHKYTLEYKNESGVCEEVDDAKNKLATKGQNVNGQEIWVVQLTDATFCSRLDGLPPVEYRVKDENGRVSEGCVTRMRYGLFVGVGEYENAKERGLSGLPEAAADASKFKKIAKQYADFDGHVYANQGAKVDDIDSALDNLVDALQCGDICLFYVTTHGDYNGKDGLICLYDDDYTHAALTKKVSLMADKGIAFIAIVGTCHAEAMLQMDLPNAAVVAAATMKDLSTSDFEQILIDYGWSDCYAATGSTMTFKDLVDYSVNLYNELFAEIDFVDEDGDECYQYRMTATKNDVGNLLGKIVARTNCVSASGITKPSAVTGLSATTGYQDKITASWNAEQGADMYYLFYGRDGFTHFLDYDSINVTQCTFYASSCDCVGESSKSSRILFAVKALNGAGASRSSETTGWISSERAVTFNARGGRPSEWRGNIPTGEEVSGTVEKGAELGILPTATKDGFVFVCWRNGNEIASHSSIVSKNVIYRAEWTAMTQTWLNAHPITAAEAIGDIATAAAMTAANGCRTVGECYALGIDPEDPDDDFKVTHFEMKDGKPVITLNHTEDGSGNSFLPRVKTLGKSNLSDAEWREVPEEGDDTMRFFKVEVEMP